MEENYPIKYVVITMYHPGYSSILSDEGKSVMGYIVGKAIVAEETIRYRKDGKSDKIYNVVVPYTDLRSKIITLPKYDAYGKLLNGTLIYEVFDSFERASEYSDELNDSLRERVSMKVFQNYYGKREYKTILEEELAKYEYYLNECKEYEQNLLSKEVDLVVESNKKTLKRK